MAAPPSDAAQQTPAIPSQLHVIKYMGSKRAIIAPVVEAITRVTPEGATVHDAFAGTHSVGYALRDRYHVQASDIQAYSAVIGQTLLASWDLLDSVACWEQLSAPYERNLAELKQIFAAPLAVEDALLAAPLPLSAEQVAAFAAFQYELPDPTRDFACAPPYAILATHLRSLVAERRAEPRRLPYVQTAAYFANTYLGIRHALQTDSLRYAIDEVFPEGHPQRAACLSALLFAVSYTNASPGHFAMWRDANASNIEDILLYRRRDLLSYFQTKLDQLASCLTRPRYDDNRAFVADFQQALAEVSADTVYADPPYTFVHYSRFYHALETLVRYDYPAVAHKGRFRDDRHQSPFCIASKVHGAFRALAEPVAARGANLVISYSNTGMIALDDMLTLLQDVYAPTGFAVWAEDIDHQHSTMGRSKDKSRDVKEAFIFCAPEHIAPSV